VLYPEATPAPRSEREGARATGRKLAGIWWAAKLRPSTPFSLQHRCTVKRYRDERFILGITPSASCLRDGNGARQRRRASPPTPRTAHSRTTHGTNRNLPKRCPQRLKRKRQGVAAAACGALGARLRTATAPPRPPDLSLTLSLSEKTTKQHTNGEKTAEGLNRTDPIFHCTPKPLQGADRNNGTEKRHKRQRLSEHGTAHGNARRKRTQAASGQQKGRQKDGSPTDGKGFADGSPSQRERQPEGSLQPAGRQPNGRR
jgi:hypothetical protein